MNTHIKKYNKMLFAFTFIITLLQTPYSIASQITISTSQDINSLATIGTDTTQTLTTLATSITNVDTDVVTQTDLMKGAGFNTSADSLHNFANNTITTPFATSAQTAAIQGTGFNSTNNSLVAISAAIAEIVPTDFAPIEGAGFHSRNNNLMVMNSYSNPSTPKIIDFLTRTTEYPGTFDFAANLNTIATGFGNAVFVYPSNNVYSGYQLVGIDNGTTSIIARVSTTNYALDTTFGKSGVYTISPNLRGISTISVDAKNNVIVAGNDSSSSCWAQQLKPTASSSAIIFAIPSALKQIYQILQQKSGRYIVAGAGASQSLIVAFQDAIAGGNTALQIDQTFNPLAVGGAASGSYCVTGTTAIYSIAINNNDTILAAYKNTNLRIAQITADGSGLTSSFGSSGELTTTIIPDSSAVCRVNIDSLGNVVLAASCGSGANVQVQRFTATGQTDSTWNSTGAIKTISNLGSANITLTNLMATTSQQAILTGYNSAGGNGRLFAVRLTSAGALDSLWNATPTAPDTNGVLTYNSQTTPAQINGNKSAIATNGNIVTIGSSNISVGSSNPIISVVVGNSSVVQVAQAPLASAAGSIDLTIPDNINGAWNLNTSSVIQGQAKKIYIFNNDSHGAMLIASTDGINVYVTKLNADLTIDRSYANSGVATLAGYSSVNDIFVNSNTTGDTAGRMYICGNNYAAQISSDGNTITYANLTSCPISTLQSIVVTSGNRILISGYGTVNSQTYGIIAAFSSVPTSGSMLQPDLSFGNDAGTGLFLYAQDTIYSSNKFPLVVDSLDRIYTAYQASTYPTFPLYLFRVLANGSAIDTTFNATVPSPHEWYRTTRVLLAFDAVNNFIILVAGDGDNGGDIFRYTLDNGSSAGSCFFNTFPLGTDGYNNAFVDDYGNIYVIVTMYHDSPYPGVWRAQSVNSTTIQPDPTYGTNGIGANASMGNLEYPFAGALNPDSRVYIIGSDRDGYDSYMGRVFGNIYADQNPINNSLVGITNYIKTLGTSPLATAAQATAIQGTGFNSTNNSLTAITTAIAGITPIDFSPIEGTGFVSADNSLVAITNDIKTLGTAPLTTSAQANAIQGTGFNSTNNSLTAITTALAGITPIDFSPIEGAGFVSTDNSLVAITNDIKKLGTAPLATSAQADAIQGTGFNPANNSLTAITTAIAGITPTDFSPIEGTGFVSANNSLVAITNNIRTLGTTSLTTPANLTSAVAPLATTTGLTSAFSPVAISTELTSTFSPVTTTTGLTSAFSQVATSTGLTSAVAPVATSTQLTATNARLLSIQSILATIIAYYGIDPIAQVKSAKGTGALSASVKSNDTNPSAITLLSTYNTNLSISQGATTKATTNTTQTYANTSAAITALGTTISSFNALAMQWAKDNSGPSTAYTAAQISAALVQLNASLAYLLTQQQAAS